MSRELQAIGEEYRKDSNDSFVSVVRSVGEINKSLLGIASEMTEHSKRSVGRAFEMQPGAAADPRPRPETVTIPFVVADPR